jgi:hypothetical protein
MGRALSCVLRIVASAVGLIGPEEWIAVRDEDEDFVKRRVSGVIWRESFGRCFLDPGFGGGCGTGLRTRGV